MANQIKVKVKAPADKPLKVTVTPLKRRAWLTDQLVQSRQPAP